MGYESGAIRICSASLTQFKNDLLLSGHSDRIEDLDWDSSNMFVISASSDRTMRLWAVSKESEEKKNNVVRALIRYCAESAVTASRFCPQNNNNIVVACRGNKSFPKNVLLVLNVDSDEFKVLQRVDLDIVPRSFVFAEHGEEHDSELYVSSSQDGTVLRFDVVSNQDVKNVLKSCLRVSSQYP